MLSQKFVENGGSPDVQIINGYNPSHLAGYGDEIESIAQTFNTPITNYDLDTILMQIEPEVTTRKILLVGHSQGTFYTNEMYDYLIQNGVPKESISIYNLATPADHVEGGGAYLTSSNDKLINQVRDWDATVRAPQALPANISIPLQPGDDTDPYGGHYFQEDYLAGAAGRIVSDINAGLGRLSASSASATSSGCFTPPSETLGYQVQSVAFAVGDPTASVVQSDVSTVSGAVVTVVQTAGTAAQSGYTAVSNALGSVVNSVVGNTSTQKNQGASAALAVSNASQVALSAPVSAVATPASPHPQTASIPQTEISKITPLPPASTIPQPVPQKPLAPPSSLIPLPSVRPLGVTPGFGGGSSVMQVQSKTSDTILPIQDDASDTLQQIPPISLAVESPDDGASFVATSTVVFAGTTTPGFFVDALFSAIEATTSADDDGTWSMSLTLPFGTTTVSFSASDGLGDVSSTTTRTISLAPLGIPVISIPVCAYSLSPSICMVATTSLELVWNDVPGAVDYTIGEESDQPGTIPPQTATSTLFDVPFNQVTVGFYIIAYDAEGDEQLSPPFYVFEDNQPLHINEVAWAGTTASAADQWIELQNDTPYPIDLSKVALTNAEGTRYLQLQGIIGADPNVFEDHISDETPDEFYVLESDPADINADLPHTFATAFDPLPRSGEELHLDWGYGDATSTLDTTPSPSTCNGWCAGFGTFFFTTTMERNVGAPDGSRASSWHTNDQNTIDGTDRKGNPIYGTPGEPNSPDPVLSPPPGPIFFST